MSGRALLVMTDGARHRRVALVADGVIMADQVVETADPVLRDRQLDDALAEALAMGQRRGLSVSGLAVATSHRDTAGDAIDAVGRRHGLPCAVYRVADGLLEGEHVLEAARDAADVLVLDMDAPAAALQIGGRAHPGAHGLAGDIAHLGLDRTGSVLCRCGRRGCLGALLAAGASAPEPPRPIACAAAPTRELGWLAVAGVTLLNVVNPELLVVAGAPVEDSDHLAWFAETVRAGCLSATRAGLRDVRKARADSALIGTAALFAADRFAIRGSR